ncbi:MAG: sugar phosphate isomerase/epimerase [Tannerella sp.]|jgi:inosose dehydratase|nr:sugar phosphate isomerase/epimerase [Tannerella sp.]
MAIKVGCFALVNPFCTLPKQLEQIEKWGFAYADLTDSTDGACLGAEYGFTAVASLDANPFDLKRLFESHGLIMTSVCAHANLLDPAAPFRYGTSQLMKAVKLAAAIGVKHVITAEGEPQTPFGKKLSRAEAIFTITEKLYEPLRLAEDTGVKILLEPHGHITDSLDDMDTLLNRCNSDALGVNLDTGNLWLGGGDSVAFIKRFGSLIGHVHWKDLSADLIPQRGKIFGCGMSVTALGQGVCNVKEAYEALQAIGFDGYSTLEIAGEEAVLESYRFLKSLGAE